MAEWLTIFREQLIQTPLIQWFGVLFGVAEVFLARYNKVALYPCGIISILITLIVLYEAGLYAEILLNLYYLVMSLYGWYYWLRKGDSKEVPITTCSGRDWWVVFSFLFVGTPVLYNVLFYFTDSTVPLWDTWVTVTAWAGMWLLAKRKLENWLLLNISNAFAVPLYIHKNLFLYAILTLFLFVVAVFGYFAWRRSMRTALNK
ncbi:nicotinamide riboside transporter PnuC [Olivibacter sp. XZL3]|uniref:nicotinamide riboside transporter PnuC n=1 Tax=Olivibacter sp. XZL3 TaxID=1735116 RepID=UPI001065A982|nr:nicotinamide riboside transporter PnuC [Olivibacter sp. XZL3]